MHNKIEMINKQLVDYIRDCSNRGMTEAQIMQMLSSSGWQKNQIDEAWDIAFGRQAVPLQQKPPQANQANNDIKLRSKLEMERPGVCRRRKPGRDRPGGAGVWGGIMGARGERDPGDAAHCARIGAGGELHPLTPAPGRGKTNMGNSSSGKATRGIPHTSSIDNLGFESYT